MRNYATPRPKSRVSSPKSRVPRLKSQVPSPKSQVSRPGEAMNVLRKLLIQLLQNVAEVFGAFGEAAGAVS